LATTNLVLADFETTVNKEGITLVDFWAEWCGPCKTFGPIFEDVSNSHTDITFAKVDTEAEQELSSMAGISSIPTLMIFRDGILLFSQAGALPKPALNELIDKVQGLDMADVHAEIAKQNSEPEAS
jgi:thioredoxin